MYRLFAAGCKYSPHPYSLPLALALASAIAAVPAAAAQAAQPQQGKRIWTTEDMDDLRARGLISIIGLETETAPATAPEAATAVPAPVPMSNPVYGSRTEDPAWYAEQARELRAQLDARAAALAQARDNLVQARNLRAPTGSVNLAAPDLGVTPEEGLAMLQAQVLEIQTQLDELADLARRNYIAPGVLRPSTA